MDFDLVKCTDLKNWSKLPTDSTKKLPTWGRGVSKIRKNCRRCLWTAPYVDKMRGERVEKWQNSVHVVVE